MPCLHFETSLIESFKIKKNTYPNPSNLCLFVPLSVFIKELSNQQLFVFHQYCAGEDTVVPCLLGFFWGGWVNLVRGNIFMLVFTAISMTVYEL